MDLKVEITGWEQECCGSRVALNQVVTWDVFAFPESTPAEKGWGTGLADVFESRHDMFTGGVSVTGRVTRIQAAGKYDGAPLATADLADVEAIRGSAELSDSVDDERDASPFAFVVTLQVADGATLPERPAEAST